MASKSIFFSTHSTITLTNIHHPPQMSADNNNDSSIEIPHDLPSSLDTSHPHISLLLQKLDESEDNLMKATQYGANLVNRVKQWETKYQDANNVAIRLENDMSDCLQDNERLESQVEDLRKERSKWQERAEEAEEKINAMEREIDYFRQMEIRNEKLRKEVDALNASVEDWNRRADAWSDDRDELEKKNTSLKERIQTLKVQLKESRDGENGGAGANGMTQRIISSKEYDELQRKLHEKEQELRQVKNEKDMDKLKSLQERNTYLLEHEELKIQLQDQEQVMRVKRQLHTVRNQFAILRETSRITKEECAKTLHNMNEEISGLSHSLSDFMNHVPLNNKEHVRYRVVDEVGYAQMQAKVIEDLGLDRMYFSLGKEKIMPQKSGFLQVCTQEKKRLWGSKSFEGRWIVFSSISVSIYQDERTDLLERRESLEGIKLGIGEGSEFFLFFPSKAKLTFRTQTKEQRDEWFTFIRKLAEQLANHDVSTLVGGPLGSVTTPTPAASPPG
mmetsp:Transcript_11128/g.41566  ORF Transcript_11128/g.41566 Transcript_11128/m.41566 type:complete len:504 (-) Transcript_11128:2014-3525(-)